MRKKQRVYSSRWYKNKVVSDEAKEKNSLAHLSEWGKLRLELYKRANRCCESCGISEEELIKQGRRRLLVHHRNYDKLIPTADDLEIVCFKCHRKLHNKLLKEEKKRYRQVCRIVIQLLNALKIDKNDENFLETPRRVTTWLLEFVNSKENIAKELEFFASAVFEFEGTDLVVLQDIVVYSICPHHLLPVEYKISISYIPCGYAVGLSKLARFAEVVASYPTLQENFVADLADSLVKFLGTEHVMVTVLGKHMCMEMRGVKRNGKFLTTAVRGAFKDDPSLKTEAYSLMELS